MKMGSSGDSFCWSRTASTTTKGRRLKPLSLFLGDISDVSFEIQTGCSLGLDDRRNDSDEGTAALQRAQHRLEIFITAIGCVTGVDGAEAVEALLADLRHYCDSADLDFTSCDRDVHLSYRAECHAKAQAQAA